jgi:hypothetical protein
MLRHRLVHAPAVGECADHGVELAYGSEGGAVVGLAFDDAELDLDQGAATTRTWG